MPSNRLTRERLLARALAYEEAADHLELEWTDDPIEREEGARLALLLRAECERLRTRARAFNFNDGSPKRSPQAVAEVVRVSSPESDAKRFMAITRGLPAYKVAQALNSIQNESDFSGCSKSRMAERWENRATAWGSKSMAILTNEDLDAALERAKKGIYVTPTQKSKALLREVQESLLKSGPLYPFREGLK